MPASPSRAGKAVNVWFFIFAMRVIAIAITMPAMATSDPYQPPDEWVEILLTLPDVERPRVLVSLSSGRGAYRPTLDLSPEITRVVGDDPSNLESDIVTIHLGEDFLPGSARDAAESLYSAACARFLETRKGDGSTFVRAGRLRLQLFDAHGRQLASHSLDVSRSAFGADDVVASSSSAADAVLRILADHSKTVSREFLSLSKLVGDQGGLAQTTLLENARGAINLVREAGELHTVAALKAAEANSGHWMDTETGTLVVAAALEHVPKGLDALGRYLDVRAAQAQAAKLEAEARLLEARARAEASRPPEPTPTRKRRPSKKA